MSTFNFNFERIKVDIQFRFFFFGISEKAMSRVEKGKLAVREKEKGNEVRHLMSLLL